jgi:hypothetical protein
MSWYKNKCECGFCEKSVRYDIEQIKHHNFIGGRFNNYSYIYNDSYSNDRYLCNRESDGGCIDFIIRHNCGDCKNNCGCGRCSQVRVYSSYRSYIKLFW